MSTDIEITKYFKSGSTDKYQQSVPVTHTVFTLYAVISEGQISPMVNDRHDVSDSRIIQEKVKDENCHHKLLSVSVCCIW